MIEPGKIEIPFSKSRMTKMLIGSVAFVLIGLWLLIYQLSISNPASNNPIIKYGVAIASILFFGFTMIYSLSKLADKKPGIVFDKEGILDNSTAIAVGLIPWRDIEGVSTVKVMKQEFVIIIVNNTEHYIGKKKNFLRRKSLEYNYKNYGSPVAISANGLKCEVNELVEIIQERLARKSVK
jgi:hypothetical protein